MSLNFGMNLFFGVNLTFGVSDFRPRAATDRRNNPRCIHPELVEG